MRRVCELVGVKVVYVELRDQFLHGLYTNHHVGRAGTDDAHDWRSCNEQGQSLGFCSVLKPLNVVLGTVLRHTAHRLDVRQQLVIEIFSVWVHAWCNLLLDGGPARDFDADDELIFQRDLALLQDFFLAKDAYGVPQGVPLAPNP